MTQLQLSDIIKTALETTFKGYHYAYLNLIDGSQLTALNLNNLPLLMYNFQRSQLSLQEKTLTFTLDILRPANVWRKCLEDGDQSAHQDETFLCELLRYIKAQCNITDASATIDRVVAINSNDPEHILLNGLYLLKSTFIIQTI